MLSAVLIAVQPEEPHKLPNARIGNRETEQGGTVNDILNGLSVKLTVIFAVILNAFYDTFDRFGESVISPVAFAASDPASQVKQPVGDGNDVEQIRQFGLSDPVRDVINGAVLTFAARRKSAVE